MTTFLIIPIRSSKGINKVYIICFYLENPTKSSLSRHTLNVAAADEKHFNHSFISPSFAPECPVLQEVMGVMVKCSEITDCGKTEQN